MKVTRLALGLAAAAACGTDSAPEATDAGPTCTAELLEADSSAGGVDPSLWPSLHEEAVVATTYLRLGQTAEVQATFDALMGPIQAELFAPAAGLLGVSLRLSEACGTARTLTAWESEADMMRFVASEAHLAAVGRVAEVSRGGSIVSHWPARALADVDWAEVVGRLEGHMGPRY